MASKDDQEISVLNKRIKTLEDKLNLIDATVQMIPASKCQNQTIIAQPCLLSEMTCASTITGPCAVNCQPSVQRGSVECGNQTIMQVCNTSNMTMTRCLNCQTIAQLWHGGSCGESIIGKIPGHELPGLQTGQNIDVISPKSNQIINGELQEGKVQIETSIAVLPQNSDVSIKIDDGSVIQTKNMSSLIMGFSSTVDVFLEVVDKDKKEKVIGGKLVMAQGHYKKGAGIAIPKGSEAKVLFRDAIYSGKIDEDVLIGMSMLEMRPESIGIKRITN